jgi:hypothetical protein
MGIMATTVRDTGRQLLRQIRFPPSARRSNRHESETAPCHVTEDRDLRIQARTRDMRRGSRPPHETAVG